MLVLDEVETDSHSLEVYECDCGHHIGVDAAYQMQLGRVTIPCPSCRELIDTAENGGE